MKGLPALLLLVFVLPLASQDLVPEAPSAVLLDQLTGRILYQKQPNLPVPPASLTKLMTLHLAWEALAAGKVSASDLVPVTAGTTGRAVPPGSSLMFLEPGQIVSFRELMLGLAVDSGNDAAMTLAQFLAGSQEAFVDRMNAEARALGLGGTHFVDTFGYDSRSLTTAADFARFSRYYLQVHPQSTSVLHSVREMTFPTDQNRAPGDPRPARSITQQNRNTLLGAYPGTDGLKTGFIDEAGYNLAATAVRGGQRLVEVLLGIPGRTTAEGSRKRTAAAIRLFDWGFSSYPLKPLPLPVLGPVRVWFGDPSTVGTAPGSPTVYPLAAGDGEIGVRIEGGREIAGPAPTGTVVGKLVWYRAGKDFYQVPLVAASASRAAPWWVDWWDNVVLFFRGFTGTPAPKTAVPRT